MYKEGNFQDHSKPYYFEFDDNFKSSIINPLFDEMEEDVEIKNYNVSDKPVLLNTPLSDKVECFAPEDDNDEIDVFIAMEVSSNFEEGYFDSEGDVTFLDNMLSDDVSHNLAFEVISDHDPEQNESSITFSSRSDPLHHEFVDFNFHSQENGHANQGSVINESLPVSPIPRIENDDSKDEDNELPNLDHQDDPSIPRPPPEPPDVEKCFEPEAGPINLGPERPRVYSDLSQDEKDRYNADIRATNIILQGLPKDIYSLINHYTDAKDIWDNVKMLLEGSELTKEDHESQL
ncbi:hypothetical protein Tco_1010134, partial [Tanacetum coccineum]